MKLSELMGAPARDELEEPLPYPCSELADPPITRAEALAADTANCRLHGGFTPHLGDHEGKVFLCGAGHMYWRYERLLGEYLGPLPYKRRAYSPVA